MISILLGCGLRRAELASLRRADVQIRQGHWAIVDLVGKGGRLRTLPMPDWVKDAVDRWLTAVAVRDGNEFMEVSRHGTSWGNGVLHWVRNHLIREVLISPPFHLKSRKLVEQTNLILLGSVTLKVMRRAH